MSDLLLNYKDISIYTRDLALLYDGQWLNDVCINFCLSRKHDELGNDELGNDSILFMDPSVVSFMTFQVDDEEEMQELADGLSVSSKEWMIIPINDCTSLGGTSSHWSLLACHIESGYLAHLDSSRQYNINSAKNIAGKLALLLKRDLKPIEQIATPQQQNGYDCGVYSILYAYSVADAITQEGSAVQTPTECIANAANNMITNITSAEVTKFRLRSIRNIESLSAAYLNAKL